jgi:hypothetical protein
VFWKPLENNSRGRHDEEDKTFVCSLFNDAFSVTWTIQGVSGGIVNILGGCIIDYFE